MRCARNGREWPTIWNNETPKAMREFFEIMKRDYQSENFTLRDWVVYGIIGPLLLIIICGTI